MNASAPGSRVLLAEDHEDTLEIYSTALTAAGFRVFETRSGMAIVNIARQEGVDAVVMDLSLVAGQLGDVLSALGQLAHVPQLIAVTGRSREGEPAEARFDRYLVKPVLPDDLIAAVRTALSC